MPPAPTQYRALTEDFRLFAERLGWPPGKRFPKALKDLGGGDKAIVARMKEGAAVPEKYIRALVGLMRNESTLSAYFTAKRLGGIETLTDDDIIERIAGPLTPAPAPPPESEDIFDKGIVGIAEVFSRFVGKLVREGTLCRDEKDVATAVAMIFATVGRHVTRDAALADAEAITAAEAIIGLSRDAYLERAVAWWRKAHWSMAFAVVNRQRVGCSCVLPLTDDAYAAVRAGRQLDYELTADDLAVPSRSFLLEAEAERSDADYPQIRKRTGRQLHTLLLQVARLSLPESPVPYLGCPIRILSFAGTPVNRARLLKLGFRPTGNRLPVHNLEILELDDQGTSFTSLAIEGLRRRITLEGDARM
ncbi:hypothetical protein [Tautonia marina]|uniref:hypothetical protein n=1 Tax=Tautonia marina TaxID=2653855 RepID=UPI0012604037|nr:hypothetical protein [Tautonia marina]